MLNLMLFVLDIPRTNPKNIVSGSSLVDSDTTTICDILLHKTGIMKKTAFIIPVHAPEHASRAPKLTKLVSEVSDAYVVLTRRADLVLWRSHAPRHSFINEIVVADWVPEIVIQTAEANRCMPTFKKWMGLAWLILNEKSEIYNYAICCDSEVEVLRPLDHAFLDSLPSQFVFVGDHIKRSEWHDNFAGLILQETKRRVPGGTHDDGDKNCDRNSVYTWWSGLPIYAIDASLTRFLESMGMLPCPKLEVLRTMSCVTFDHLIYQRHIMQQKNGIGRLVCLTHDVMRPSSSPILGWSLELASSSTVMEAVRERAGLKTLWTSRVMRLKNPDAVADAYLEYHTDRTAALE